MPATASAAPISGRRRAAVALVALGRERAAEILRGLEVEEVRELASAVAELGPVTPDEVRLALGQLSDGLATVAPQPLKAPGAQYAQDLVVLALGDRGTTVAAELAAPAAFAWLADADPDIAAGALANEPRGVIALALAHVESRAAARLLTRLPDEIRGPVAARIAGLGPLHPDTLTMVDASLRGRMTDVSLSSPVKQVAGPQLLAGLLTRAGAEARNELLAAIAETDAELASATRDALFTFDDLCALESRTLQTVLRSIDGRQLAAALFGMSQEVVDRLLSNLSERAREALLEEIDLQQDLKPAAVQEARLAVVGSARKLEEEGQVVLRADEDAA
jgi:flagellar motor switch protein FliG